MSHSYGLANPPPTCNFRTANVTAPPLTTNRSCTVSNEADVVGPAYYECCAGATPVLYNGDCQIWCNITDGFLYEANTSASHLTTEFNQCILGALQAENKTNVTYNATCFSPFAEKSKTSGAESMVKLSGALLMGLVGVTVALQGAL